MFSRKRIKKKAQLSVICAAFATVCACLAQPPPNDQFTNATVLVGDNVFFTGNLTGSTGGTNEVAGVPFIDPFWYVQHSVWWSWTASESVPVTLAALSLSEDTYNSEDGDTDTYIAIYSITNDTAAGWYKGVPPAINAIWLNGAFDKLSFTFTASAGTTYQIQLADFYTGNSTMQVNFQLAATNAPVILEQPADQTIAPNGSAFFSVLAAGIEPFSYQWYSNGVAIPGAIWPMLALDNVTCNQAGAYSVMVSNATGIVTSQNANLTINPTRSSPYLSLIAQSSNGFAISLFAESGTYWRIESSTDLVTWLPETSFPSTPTILLSSNTPTSFSARIP